MHSIKKMILAAGFGEAYYNFWWLHRCPFEPLTDAQVARGHYFVHIPKTAGTSVLTALGQAQTPYTHCPAHIIHRRYPVPAKSLFFFAVVRNPYTRFASSFEYIIRRSDWPEQRRFAQEAIGDLSFPEFAEKMLANRRFRNLIMGYEFFFPQSFFTHVSGQSKIQDFLRFETINRDFDDLVARRIPDAKPLPTLRDHGGGDYLGMYDETARRLVRQLYAKDFQNFGYEV